MRSILVQAGRDRGMAARLDTAMNLARSLDGHVTLAIDTPIDQFVAVDPYGGTFVAREALDAALAADDALAEAFAVRCGPVRNPAAGGHDCGRAARRSGNRIAR